MENVQRKTLLLKPDIKCTLYTKKNIEYNLGKEEKNNCSMTDNHPKEYLNTTTTQIDAREYINQNENGNLLKV